MSKVGERIVVWILRIMGTCALFALAFVFMPMSWMADAHRRMGLGELPAAPIVEYLARSLSAFYFLFGVLCLLAATDIVRHRMLVRILGLTFLLMGLLFAWMDYSMGMPWWWSVLEGPPQIVLGALMLYLGRDTGEKQRTA